MKPVLFTIFDQPISSFGVFLIISILISAFFIWRIIRVYELDEEKVLDLIIITFTAGLISSRLYFYILNFDKFNDLLKIILINKYPGLSFWGGLMGGLVGLLIFSKRFKMNFWQLGDFAVVGFLIGSAISSFGCLLASCQYGLVTDSSFAINQVGLIGKRFPLQIIEGLIYLFLFFSAYKAVLRFHFAGQILAKSLILFGVFKLILEFFRGNREVQMAQFSLGILWSVFLIVSGIWVYYHQSRRSFKADLWFILSLYKSKNNRTLVVSKTKKSWYNLRVNFKVALQKWFRRLFKLINVRPNPQKF